MLTEIYRVIVREVVVNTFVDHSKKKITTFYFLIEVITRGSDHSPSISKASELQRLFHRKNTFYCLAAVTNVTFSYLNTTI
jgi:hypothetical protein